MGQVNQLFCEIFYKNQRKLYILFCSCSLVSFHLTPKQIFWSWKLLKKSSQAFGQSFAEIGHTCCTKSFRDLDTIWKITKAKSLHDSGPKVDPDHLSACCSHDQLPLITSSFSASNHYTHKFNKSTPLQFLHNKNISFPVNKQKFEKNAISNSDHLFVQTKVLTEK